MIRLAFASVLLANGLPASARARVGIDAQQRPVELGRVGGGAQVLAAQRAALVHGRVGAAVGRLRPPPCP